jgi:hypothetical protein
MHEIDLGPPPSLDAVAVWLMCGSAVVDAFWSEPRVVDFDDFVAGWIDEHLENVVVPSLEIGANPPTFGVTGLASWFWVEGWDGAPSRSEIEAPWGDVVVVELEIEEVTWDFGDGSGATASGMGESYPQESSVRHVYTHTSADRGDYGVTAEVGITGRWWFGAEGPWEVPAVTVSLRAEHEVRQIQAVIG